jgi:hypothetical protein
MKNVVQITSLKVKCLSLAAEAAVIRRQERRALAWQRKHPSRYDPIYGSLRDHRRFVVRPEARHALLAYAFLRGRPYAAVERNPRELPDFARVWKIVTRFSPEVLPKAEREAQVAAWDGWVTAAKATFAAAA